MAAVAPIDEWTLIDTQGQEWHLQHNDPELWGVEGVKLCDDPKGFDGPVFTKIIQQHAGQEGGTDGGTRWDYIEGVFKVRLYHRTGRPKSVVESEWRQGWSPDETCMLKIHRPDEGTTRWLFVQLKERLKPETSRGKDRNLFPHHDMIMTVLALDPWWHSGTHETELETTTFVPDPSPNRVWDPGFDDLLTLWWTGGGWTKDTGVGHTAPGSARTTANGTRRILRAKSIPARGGQLWTELSAWVRWQSLTITGSGAAITLEVEAFNGGDSLGVTTVGNIVDPGTGGTWAQLKTTSFVTPPNTTNIRIQLAVESRVLLGTVWADDFIATSVLTYTATMTAPVWNPCDRDMYLRYELSAEVETIWEMPDYSFGSKSQGRPVVDAARTIRLKEIQNGQELNINTYPLEERIVADDATLQWARQNAVDWLYPVPAYTPPTTLTFKATVVDTSKPVGLIIFQDRKWSMPYGLQRAGIPEVPTP
ncbi:hypothetical protein [Tsukamurella sp. NPDC003166]|uniref:hypothetical protein n=1 Tax=Tsukamurella sp. NPDC003166 TaxID=3154444 RepID=UPI0033B98782